MAVSLASELDRFGIDVEEFRDVVQEMKAVMFPDWSDEELLFHHAETGAYIATVRRRLCCPDLPDHLILRTLINIRKNTF